MSNYRNTAIDIEMPRRYSGLTGVGKVFRTKHTKFAVPKSWLTTVVIYNDEPVCPGSFRLCRSLPPSRLIPALTLTYQLRAHCVEANRSRWTRNIYIARCQHGMRAYDVTAPGSYLILHLTMQHNFHNLGYFVCTCTTQTSFRSALHPQSNIAVERDVVVLTRIIPLDSTRVILQMMRYLSLPPSKSMSESQL